jgi:hypothetical protein
LDGARNTWWHTDFAQQPHSPLPHHLDIFFGYDTHLVHGIVMLPRPDPQVNGRIGKYEIYVSKDGKDWGSQPVAVGEWLDTDDEKVWFSLNLNSKLSAFAKSVSLFSAKCVKFVCYTSIGLFM